MTAFLWFFIVMTALSVVGKLRWLATGDFPRRTAKEQAFDVFAQSALIAWAVWLL